MAERQQKNPEDPVRRALTSTANRMSMGAKYQGALEAVLAIPIGAGLGHWADREWEVSPWGLLIGFGLGFAAFVLRLMRMRPEGESLESEQGSEEEK